VSGSSAYELEARPATSLDSRLKLEDWNSDRFIRELLSSAASETQRPRGRSFTLEIHAKTLRDRSAQGFLDQFSELVVTHLGMGLGIPVLPMWLKIQAGLGPCLLSPFVGETRLEGQTVDDRLRGELTKLATFEEWVMNEDDKPDHLRLVSTANGGRHVVLLDHGHTLHAWKQGMDSVDQLRVNPRLVQPSSGFKHSGISHANLVPEIDRIRRVGDDEIAAVIRTVLEQYDALRPDVPEVDALLSQRDRHETSALAILTARRDNLEAILRVKYGA
jgi:hypothetical protein